jgi:hypothetical protein
LVWNYDQHQSCWLSVGNFSENFNMGDGTDCNLSYFDQKTNSITFFLPGNKNQIAIWNLENSTQTIISPSLEVALGKFTTSLFNTMVSVELYETFLVVTNVSSITVINSFSFPYRVAGSFWNETQEKLYFVAKDDLQVAIISGTFSENFTFVEEWRSTPTVVSAAPDISHICSSPSLLISVGTFSAQQTFVVWDGKNWLVPNVTLQSLLFVKCQTVNYTEDRILLGGSAADSGIYFMEYLGALINKEYYFNISCFITFNFYSFNETHFYLLCDEKLFILDAKSNQYELVFSLESDFNTTSIYYLTDFVLTPDGSEIVIVGYFLLNISNQSQYTNVVRYNLKEKQFQYFDQLHGTGVFSIQLAQENPQYSFYYLAGDFSLSLNKNTASNVIGCTRDGICNHTFSGGVPTTQGQC